MTTRLLLLPLLTCATSLALAAKDADLKPALVNPGKVAFASTFDSGLLAAPWTMPKGDWSIKDGAIVGKEKASDNHPAVLALGLPRRDSAIRFSFKLDGAKTIQLSLNHAKGHLFRVVVTPEALTVNKDKDKKDESSKGAVLGRANAKFAAGEWYTMLLEIRGGKVSVQTDNGAKVEANDPTLDVDKTGYRFVTRGESVALDDLKVWESTPATPPAP